MSERLDRVQVETRYGSVVISWAAREAILDELRGLESARGAVAAFEAVGASRPVELDQEGKSAVLDAIVAIADKGAGYHRIQPGLFRLRAQLRDELRRR